MVFITIILTITITSLVGEGEEGAVVRQIATERKRRNVGKGENPGMSRKCENPVYEQKLRLKS